MHNNGYKLVYEDKWLMVVDKPSGLLVIPTPKNEKRTLTNLINEDLDRRGLEINAYPCHRLDRGTSGLILYAKGKTMQKLMMDEFRRRSVKKGYIAFVHGIVRRPFDTIRRTIYNKNKKRNETAVTKYRLMAVKKNFSIVEAEPVTGRTNQIRIHMKEIGHPLVGEDVYVFRKDFKLRFNRVALHSQYLEFTHPKTGQNIKFISGLPEDMEKLKNTG